MTDTSTTTTPPDPCPHCSAPMGPDGKTFLCGSQWRRRWYGRRYLVQTHQCKDDRACRDACMVLIASTINRNGKAATWPFGELELAENKQGYGDWYVTAGRKARTSPTKKKRRLKS